MSGRDWHGWIVGVLPGSAIARPRRRHRALGKTPRLFAPAIEALERRMLLSATPTSITVSASVNSAVYAQAVNLTANVSASPSAPSEGNVAFYNNGGLLATQPVSSGAATFDNVILPAGTDLITASYSDTSGNFASSSTVVGPNSIITTVAGNGAGGFSGDGGTATAAQLNSPYGVAVDSSDNLFIADSANNVVREVDHATGLITTVAGGGTAGLGDGGPATAAELHYPTGVAVDSSGDLFIADYANDVVREVNYVTRVITIVAGNGTFGASGDGGPATAAQLNYPEWVAIDSSGDLFIADTDNNRIRKVDHATGIITTVAGNGTAGFSGDGGPATAAKLDDPEGLAVDSSGDLFIADGYNHVIREVDLATDVITTVAGDRTQGFSGDGNAATAAELNYPRGVAVDSSGHLFIADYQNERIREVNLATAVITTVAGNGTPGFSGGSGAATAAELDGPVALAADSSGDVFIADLSNNRIREVASGAAVVDVAPPPAVTTQPASPISASGATLNGTVNPEGSTAKMSFQYSTDATFPATVETTVATGFASAHALSVDAAGDVFVADETNDTVDEVQRGGTTLTIGSGFLIPSGVAVDGAGDVFIADTGNETVKEVRPNGTIQTIGSAYMSPSAVAVDASGDVFIADKGDNVVKEVLAHGTSKIIGSGFFSPYGIAVDSSGDVLVADSGNNAVKEVLPDGTIKTIGSGFYSPDGVAVDMAGDVFVADSGNSAVKEVLRDGTIRMVGSGYIDPEGIAVDATGDVFVGDNNRVVELSPPTVAGTPSSLRGSTGTAVSGTLLGLTPGTTYYYRTIATSSTDEVADTTTQSFTTLAPPSVVTTAATSISAAGATFNGTANPDGSTTTAYFQYSTAATLIPNVEKTIGSGFSEPYGVALDASGDVFVADKLNGAVKEVPPDGSIKTIGSGFSEPYGVALDTAGDFYIDDLGNDDIKEVLPNGTIKTIGTRFSFPTGVAVDASGDVFVADASVNAVKEVLPNGTINTVGSGFSSPQGVAVDAAGDVFVADTFHNAVKEVLPDSTVKTIGSGFASPTGVAVDASGDIFVADFGTNTVNEVLPNGTITTIGSGFSSPSGVAVDAAGDVFVADYGNGRVVEISPLMVAATPSPLVGSTAQQVSGAVTGLIPGTTYYYRAVAASAGGTVADTTIPPESITTPTITWANPADIMYGTAIGATQLDATSSVPGTFVYTLADEKTPASGTVLHAGQSQVLNATFTPSDSAHYATETAQVQLNVNPAALTITADDKSKVYGAALPTLTTSYSGFVDGDSAASLATPPTLSTTATASSHVSGNPYSITASGAVDANYTITYVAGALTVTRATLTITADDKSKVYGAAVPSLTASYSGFVNGDTSASLTTQPMLSTTATDSSHVSGSPYTITASGALDADYTISYVAGSLSVTRAALAVTADDKTMAYGAPLPTLTASYSGFVNGDTAASLTTQPALSTTATAGSHVSGSPYAITASGAVDSDYTISYVAGALTVTRAVLTITADDKSKVYGAAVPSLTASDSGFVNGDTAASLKTQPTLSTTATAGSHVSGSPYAITASGAVDSDYTISYVAGALTVTPAALTITADDKSKVYGAALSTLTASYSGFVNGDAWASLTTRPSLSTKATAGSPVSGSPYEITASGAVDSDYTISYGAGALTVTPAALAITADDKSKVYGAALPTLTASYSGFVNGDTAASLKTQPTLSTTATGGSHVAGGPYAITASGAADPDYTISYVAGALTVTPVALTVTADDESKVYGAALSTLTASYSGFVNGDTAASLKTQPTLSTTATAGSHVSGGPYAITASGAADSDYTISYVAGALTVTPAALTITADDKSKVYGAAVPSLTASYSGFVNGDTSASLTTQPTLSTTATAGSHISGSPYSITASGAVDADYTISYVSGALTVTPALLTITANDQTMVYGGALSALTVSYSGLVNGDTSATFNTSPNTPPTVSASATKHVGSYAGAVVASGAVDADYSTSYVPAKLTVTPAPLTITADDKSKVYGAALPTLTASYSGLVNGDTIASLTTQPTLSTTATASSYVSGSPYPITASSAVDADYTISYVTGRLTVTPAPLIVTADDKSKVYGAAVPSLTASYSGFVNGDSAASLTTAPSLATTGTAGSQVPGSPYPITASGAVDADYTISYVAGTLTITPATLILTADDKARGYGAQNPPLTYTITGFVNGDTPSVVSGEAALSTTATAASGPGTYPIVAAAGTLSAADYTVNFENGTLMVTTNLQGAFGLVEDIYVIGSGTFNVSSTNGVLANDTGPGQLTVVAGTVTGAEGGTFTLNADGSFTYTPPSNFPGFDYAKYTATDAAGDRASATVNVLSQPGGVVWKFYESVLARDPDYGGLKFWINDFANGGKTGDIAVGFFESPELLNKVIGGYYEQYLLRSADAAGLAHWETVWGENGGPEKIRAFFAESAEFYASAGGTPDAWINALYQRILARAPDPDGEQHWLEYYQQQIAAGVDAPTIRYNIALFFLTSPEGFGNDVTGWFHEFLLRAPTDGEQQQYTSEMLAGETDRQVEQEITNLPEYGQNPPASPAGTAQRLPDYFQPGSPPSSQQAVVAAKDAVFRQLDN